MSRGRSGDDHLLLGEWACLGIIDAAPTHGFAVAARLAPTGDIGRIWSLSRALTYRAVDQLGRRGYVEPIGEERGIAGGNRTVLGATRVGHAELRRWLTTPVAHLRDLRSELLLKIALAGIDGVDIGPMLRRQHEHVAALAEALAAQVTTAPDDVVALWRHESARAALRFLDQVADR
jgi:PadR family transcriptional regulator AphA